MITGEEGSEEHVRRDEALVSAGGATALVENHRAFLRYLERRVGSREAAEDILQDAFVRTIGRTDDVPDEALVPWFYRVLRNAVIDRARRAQTADRALEAFAREVETVVPPADDLLGAICGCITRLASTLKVEYAEVLQAVEVDNVSVKTYAERQGLSASNAGVRLFRARQLLKKRVRESCGTCAEHGCVDCSCGSTRR